MGCVRGVEKLGWIESSSYHIGHVPLYYGKTSILGTCWS